MLIGDRVDLGEGPDRGGGEVCSGRTGVIEQRWCTGWCVGGGRVGDLRYMEELVWGWAEITLSNLLKNRFKSLASGLLSSFPHSIFLLLSSACALFISSLSLFLKDSFFLFSDALMFLVTQLFSCLEISILSSLSWEKTTRWVVLHVKWARCGRDL